MFTEPVTSTTTTGTTTAGTTTTGTTTAGTTTTGTTTTGTTTAGAAAKRTSEQQKNLMIKQKVKLTKGDRKTQSHEGQTMADTAVNKQLKMQIKHRRSKKAGKEAEKQQMRLLRHSGC